MHQGELHPDDCAMKDGATQLGSKVVVEVTIHDWMEKVLLGGVGRRNLWKAYLDIFHQRYIYDKKMEGTVVFEFKTSYKYGIMACRENFYF